MTRSPLLVDYQRQQELLPIEFLFFFSGTQFLGISLFETSNMIYRLDSLCLDNYSLNWRITVRRGTPEEQYKRAIEKMEPAGVTESVKTIPVTLLIVRRMGIFSLLCCTSNNRAGLDFLLSVCSQNFWTDVKKKRVGRNSIRLWRTVERCIQQSCNRSLPSYTYFLFFISVPGETEM